MNGYHELEQERDRLLDRYADVDGNERIRILARLIDIDEEIAMKKGLNSFENKAN